MTRTAIKYTFETPEGVEVELVGKVNVPSMIKKGYKLIYTEMTTFYMDDDVFYDTAERIPSGMTVTEYNKQKAELI